MAEQNCQILKLYKMHAALTKMRIKTGLTILKPCCNCETVTEI